MLRAGPFTRTLGAPGAGAARRPGSKVAAGRSRVHSSSRT